MKPSFGSILMGCADAIAVDIAPRLTDDYARSQAAIVGILMALVANEADRAADTLSLESIAMRALFAEAAAQPLPEPLRRRLRAMAEAQPAPTFKVQALEDLVEPMRALLIELHEALEDRPDAWARPLEMKVWDILRIGADNRTLYLPVL